LAGVAPLSRNLEEWNGTVRFEDENSTAIVSYALLAHEDNPDRTAMVSRISKALDGFCIAAGLVQSAGFCCDSFTILRYTHKGLNLEKGGLAQVELWRMELRLAVELFAEVKRLSFLDDVTQSEAISIQIITIQILEPFLPVIIRSLYENNVDYILYLCSLAVQFLYLDFLSYI
jgi:hypothetical protein